MQKSNVLLFKLLDPIPQFLVSEDSFAGITVYINVHLNGLNNIFTLILKEHQESQICVAKNKVPELLVRLHCKCL